MLQNIQSEFVDNLMDAMLDKNRAMETYLKIYQRNITHSLLTVLKSFYPLICKLLGEDFFVQCSLAYIRDYPSRSGNLHDYGAYFADFLAEHEFTNHLTYLPEVAILEWTCHCLQHVVDHAALDFTKLENMTPARMGQLKLNLHPASSLQTFRYPIMQIIDLCNGEIDHDLDIREGGVNLLIIRREFDIKLVPLTTAEYTFLHHLQEGHMVADALQAATEIAAQHPQEANFRLEEKIPQWISEKTLVDCYY